MLSERIKSLLGIGSDHQRSYELVFLSYISFFAINIAIYLVFAFNKLQTQSHLWALIGVGIIYITYLLTGWYRMCSYAMIMLNYVHIFFNALLTGGIHSPAVACLTFMPTGALMLGRKSAFFWLYISMGCISALAIINYYVPDIQNYHMSSDNAMWSVIMQMSMSVILFVTVWLFNLINEQRLSELEKKSAELALTHEALKSAQAHKDEFIAAVGHELRTPMNAILGFTDIISHEIRSSKALQTISHIQTSAKQLLKVVSNILDYSQLMAGKLHLSLKQDRPSDLVQETIASIKHQYQNQPIDIIYKCASQAPTTCLLDSFRIRQVLEHLLSNAIKFMEQGRIEVLVTGNEQLLRIEVNDSGIGISEEKQNSIFKRFEHANREINRRYGGTGLGLAICDKLIELHHGRIGVKSTLGFGSTFWFEIPTNPIIAIQTKQHNLPDDNSLATIETQPKHFAQQRLSKAYQWLIEILAGNSSVSSHYPRNSRAEAKLQLMIGASLPGPLYYYLATDTRLASVLAIYPLFFALGVCLLIFKANYKFAINLVIGLSLLIILITNLYMGGSHGVMNWTTILSLPAFSLLGEIAGLTWLAVAIFSQLIMLGMTSLHLLPIAPEDVDQPIGLFWLAYLHLTILSVQIPLYYKQVAGKVRDAILLNHVSLEQTQADLLQEQKVKDDFISSVSHEFRTPMNAIMGFNYILREQIKDEPTARELQEHVTQSAEHLLTVIDDIFDFSELQHGQLSIRKDPFDIQQIFQNAYGMFLSKTRKLDYKLQISSMPRWVIGDSHRLMQILVNLIGNALKFTHHGYVYVSAQASHGGIQFKVTDSGVGIEADKLGLIFSQYGQVHHDRAKLGHGLGLAICKRLIEQQNGTIEVDSRLHTGSCFSVWLPYPICPKPLEIFTNDEQQMHMNKFLKILIVDDHPLNRLLARQIFERTWSDATIDEAEDGAKAIQKIRNHTYDIVIMDMVMPEMDGIEATTLIRTSMHDDKRDIPILGLTANVNPIDKERCIQAGMNDIIYKPFNKDDLIHSIERLINPVLPIAKLA